MLKRALSNNRPVAAGGLAGAVALLLVTLVEWGLAEFGIQMPPNVELALTLVVVSLVGGSVGKVAQRHTWAESTHKAAVSFALQLDPEHWAEAIESLGMSRNEAAEVIGVDSIGEGETPEGAS